MMFDNGSVPRSRAKSIGARARAAACRKHAAVSCLAVSCDWSDEGHADVCTRCTRGSQPCKQSSHTFNKTICQYVLIAFNRLFINAKILES